MASNRCCAMEMLGNSCLSIKPGHLILCDGVISHNLPQIASDRTIIKTLLIHKNHKIVTKKTIN